MDNCTCLYVCTACMYACMYVSMYVFTHVCNSSLNMPALYPNGNLYTYVFVRMRVSVYV